MPLRPLSRDEVRSVDRRAIDEFGLSGLVLMENAGRGAAEWLHELCKKRSPGPIAICCGKGNNAGDGFVMARHLEVWGHIVHTVLVGEPDALTGDALVNFRVLQAARSPIVRWDEPAAASSISTAAWIVDALLGTGAVGEVREPLRAAIDAINRSAARKFAVDIPSGLDADTGQPLGVAVGASYTATFVAPKSGFLKPGASAYTGEVRVFEIGVPRRLLDDYRSP